MSSMNTRACTAPRGAPRCNSWAPCSVCRFSGPYRTCLCTDAVVRLHIGVLQHLLWITRLFVRCESPGTTQELRVNRRRLNASRTRGLCIAHLGCEVRGRYERPTPLYTRVCSLSKKRCATQSQRSYELNFQSTRFPARPTRGECPGT